jgi:general stress protein 26
MEKKNLKKEFLSLMETADVVYLSTIDENGFPQTRAMGNLRNKTIFSNLDGHFERHREDFLVYLATDTASAKVQQIKSNPNASVYYCKVNESFGLMLVGLIEIVRNKKLKRELWQKRWEKYYPNKEYALLRFLPDLAKGWYKTAPFEINLR